MPDPPTARAVPMFPLGTVLVPGADLPLRVFEPRYRSLVRAVLEDDRRFGVVLIERGSEVGGGDARSAFGTMAEVLGSREHPDGQFTVLARGESRIRVVEWLADDPYPRAVVEDWPDGPVDTDRLPKEYARASRRLRTALGLAGELGYVVAPVDVQLPDDPSAGSHALVAFSPMGPLDRQRLLAAVDARERLALFETLIDEQIETMSAQMRTQGR